jgi:hypothetical protein
MEAVELLSALVSGWDMRGAKPDFVYSPYFKMLVAEPRVDDL